ncbi:MAG: hypothetical protein U0736_12720 [Gemmataceae bacterium]
MTRAASPFALAALLAALFALTAGADEEGVPSFKNAKDRETKEFASRVGAAIVRAARSKAQKIEMEKYEYTAPKEGRRELKLNMVYFGVITKTKYTADVTVLIDSSEPTRWEVVNIRYKDSNKSPVGYSEKKIQELIKVLNR